MSLASELSPKKFLFHVFYFYLLLSFSSYKIWEVTFLIEFFIWLLFMIFLCDRNKILEYI